MQEAKVMKEEQRFSVISRFHFLLRAAPYHLNA